MSSVRIILKNLKDNEVLNYPVLFIRGQVEAADDGQAPLNGKLLVHHEGIVSELKVCSGKFKCLLELKLGQNSIKIIYENNQYHGECLYSFERRTNDSPKFVRLFYVIPQNREREYQSLTLDTSPGNACKKITTGFKLLQTFFAERLNEQGFGRKTFKLHGECRGEGCEIFASRHSKETFQSRTSEEIWTLIAKELLEQQLISDHSKVFAILGCTEYCKDTGQVKGHVACGRGHFAMLGSLGLHSLADKVSSIMDQLSSRKPTVNPSSSVVSLR